MLSKYLKIFMRIFILLILLSAVAAISVGVIFIAIAVCVICFAVKLIMSRKRRRKCEDATMREEEVYKEPPNEPKIESELEKRKKQGIYVSDEWVNSFASQCNAYVEREEEMEEYKKYFNLK